MGIKIDIFLAVLLILRDMELKESLAYTPNPVPNLCVFMHDTRAHVIDSISQYNKLLDASKLTL